MVLALSWVHHDLVLLLVVSDGLEVVCKGLSDDLVVTKLVARGGLQALQKGDERLEDGEEDDAEVIVP